MKRRLKKVETPAEEGKTEIEDIRKTKKRSASEVRGTLYGKGAKK